MWNSQAPDKGACLELQSFKRKLIPHVHCKKKWLCVGDLVQSRWLTTMKQDNSPALNISTVMNSLGSLGQATPCQPHLPQVNQASLPYKVV